MKTKTLKSNFTVPIVLAVALVLVLSATFALFTETANGSRTFRLSNFTSSAVVYFDDHSSLASPASPDGVAVGTSANTTASYYDLALADGAGVTNFIGDLRVAVKYNGKGVGLVRVRVTEEWYGTSTDNGTTIYTVKPYKIEIPYLIGNSSNGGLYSGSGNQKKWFDNRTSDYCFYYATPIKSNSEVTIPLIAGVNTSEIDLGAIDTTTTHVRLIVEADAVQVNRYPQYWGINVLPWGIHDVNDSNYAAGRPSSATEEEVTNAAP